MGVLCAQAGLIIVGGMGYHRNDTGEGLGLIPEDINDGLEGNPGTFTSGGSGRSDARYSTPSASGDHLFRLNDDVYTNWWSANASVGGSGGNPGATGSDGYIPSQKAHTVILFNAAPEDNSTFSIGNYEYTFKHCPTDTKTCWDGKVVSRDKEDSCKFFPCSDQPVVEKFQHTNGGTTFDFSYSIGMWSEDLSQELEVKIVYDPTTQFQQTPEPITIQLTGTDADRFEIYQGNNTWGNTLTKYVTSNLPTLDTKVKVRPKAYINPSAQGEYHADLSMSGFGFHLSDTIDLNLALTIPPSQLNLTSGIPVTQVPDTVIGVNDPDNNFLAIAEQTEFVADCPGESFTPVELAIYGKFISSDIIISEETNLVDVVFQTSGETASKIPPPTIQEDPMRVVSEVVLVTPKADLPIGFNTAVVKISTIDAATSLPMTLTYRIPMLKRAKPVISANYWDSANGLGASGNGGVDSEPLDYGFRQWLDDKPKVQLRVTCDNQTPNSNLSASIADDSIIELSNDNDNFDTSCNIVDTDVFANQTGANDFQYWHTFKLDGGEVDIVTDSADGDGQSIKLTGFSNARVGCMYPEKSTEHPTGYIDVSEFESREVTPEFWYKLENTKSHRSNSLQCLDLVIKFSEDIPGLERDYAYVYTPFKLPTGTADWKKFRKRWEMPSHYPGHIIGIRVMFLLYYSSGSIYFDDVKLDFPVNGPIANGLVIRPKDGLSIGEHTDTITISTDCADDLTLPVAFNVLPGEEKEVNYVSETDEYIYIRATDRLQDGVTTYEIRGGAGGSGASSGKYTGGLGIEGNRAIGSFTATPGDIYRIQAGDGGQKGEAMFRYDPNEELIDGKYIPVEDSPDHGGGGWSGPNASGGEGGDYTHEVDPGSLVNGIPIKKAGTTEYGGGGGGGASAIWKWTGNSWELIASAGGGGGGDGATEDHPGADGFSREWVVDADGERIVGPDGEELNLEVNITTSGSGEDGDFGDGGGGAGISNGGGSAEGGGFTGSGGSAWSPDNPDWNAPVYTPANADGADGFVNLKFIECGSDGFVTTENPE